MSLQQIEIQNGVGINDSLKEGIGQIELGNDFPAIIAIDSIEEFNTSKTELLFPSSGEILGKSADDVGANNPSTQNSFTPFIPGGKPVSTLLNLTDSSANRNFTIPHDAKYEMGTDIVEWRLYMIVPEDSGTIQNIQKRGTGGWWDIRFNGVTSSITLIFNDSVEGLTILDVSGGNFRRTELNELIVRRNGTTWDTVEVYLNERKLTTTLDSGSGIINDISSNTADIQSYFNASTRMDSFFGIFNLLIAGSLVESFNFTGGNNNTVIGSGGAIATLNNFIAGELETGGQGWVQKGLSNAPINGLVLNGSITYGSIADFSPPTNGGYSILVDCAFSEGGDVQKFFFTKTGLCTMRIRTTNLYSFSGGGVTPSISLNSYNIKKRTLYGLSAKDFAVGLFINGNRVNNYPGSTVAAPPIDEIVGATTLSRNSNGTQFSPGIYYRVFAWNRVLSPQEMATITKDYNPEGPSLKGLQLALIFNEANFYTTGANDGTDLYVKNLAPASEIQGGDPSIWDMQIAGFSSLEDALTKIYKTF